MAYAYVSLSSALSDLQARLFDPQGQFPSSTFFWTQAELIAYIQEAIRTWNALANYFRAEFTFQLSQGVNWYDITNLATAPKTLRPFTITDNILTQVIEYHLLEPLTTTYPLVWSGSAQFNISQIVSTLSSSNQTVLGSSGCTVAQTLYPETLGRVFVNDQTIDIRRVAFIPLGGSPVTLFPSDIQAEQDFDFGWTTKSQGLPTQYLVNSEPPLSFDVDRVPGTEGQYEVISVSGVSGFSLTSSSLLKIPDDWSWVAKWGALSRILSSPGSPSDPLRAMYAQRRFEDGIAALKNASGILGLRLNNIPLALDSLRDYDDFNLSWESLAQGAPGSACLAGQNLLGFSSPDAGNYSVTVSCVQNAPVPVNLGDFVQIGRDDYDTIINYSQHLATFKLGGGLFEATIPYFQQLLQRASLYNSKLGAAGIFTLPILDISGLNEARAPRIDPGLKG